MSNNGHDHDPPDLETIIKLMGMTGSDHDAEAISALRMATSRLKKWGWTWDSILRGKIKIMPDPFNSIPNVNIRQSMRGAAPRQAASPPPPPRQFDNKDEIEKYIAKLEFRKLPDSVQQRINNIERTWRNQGFLLYTDYDFLRTTANSRKRY